MSDYKYDATHRLLQEVVTDASLGNRTTDFTYDTVGNRISQTENGITTSYTYNANDHLLESNDGSVITSYQYDANGNTTQQNQGLALTAYEYSQDNRMIRATSSTDTLDYSYNAGIPETFYTYGDDLVSQARNSQSHYYLYDGLGSTRGLSDQSGAVTDSYVYKAFGELVSQIRFYLMGFIEKAFEPLGRENPRSANSKALREIFNKLDFCPN